MALLQIPPEFNRSAAHLRDPAAAERSAVFLLRYACDVLGFTDLSDKAVLDVGCGTKFTQAILNHDVPITRYVGVDVYAKMIDFLRSNVTDPRFEYHHVNVRNDLYNPAAPPMTEETDLGVGDETFDVIWLFSVFTHLAPHDYDVMLKLLRRHVRPGGRLLYTVFIDELTDGGHGFTDRMNRAVHARHGGGNLSDQAPSPAARPTVPFRDVYPEHPLRVALYSRQHAFDLIDGTGWKPVELLPPNEFAQHHFVCAPV